MQQGKINKLRVAVLWNGSDLKQWQADALDELFSVEGIEPVLFISPASSPSWHKPSFLYRLFRRFTDHPLMSPVALPENYRAVEQLKVIPEKKGKFREVFSQDDIRKITSYAPDLIIRFGFSILSGDILTCAKYGVWSYHHGDPLQYRGGPPLFWEYRHSRPVTGAILQRLTERLDAGLVIRKGKFLLDRHSFKTTQGEVFRVSSSWLRLAAIELMMRGELKSTAVVTSARLTTWPGNTDAVIVMLKLLAGRFTFYFNKYFLSEDWAIARINQPLEKILRGEKINKPEWITAGKRSRYLADPFAYEWNGTTYFIAEEYSYHTGKGRLVSEHMLNPSGSPLFLDESYHRSYPYTFLHEGTWYMIAETAGIQKTDLYLLSDEGSWSFAGTLLDDFPAVDPSLIFHEGKWWLFCTSAGHKSSNRDLYIFYSERLSGPYLPHALNPVKNDLATSRPGGTMVHLDNKLLRVAQDSSAGYGTCIHIMEIEELSESLFSEKQVRTIFPFSGSRYKTGIHTLSSAGAYTLADGKRMIFRFSYTLLKIKNLLRRE